MVVIDGVEMLDVREAAALARRTPETIRRWVWSGRLVARRKGNRLLLARVDVQRLAAISGADRDDGPAATLTGWAALADQARGSGLPGVSARDLVLEDRRRSDNADAGR